MEQDALIDRFRDHAVNLRLERLADQLAGRIGRDQDCRQQLVVNSYLLERFESGHPRHVHIEKDQVDRFELDDLDRFFAAGRGDRAETAIPEHLRERIPATPIIVGDENRNRRIETGHRRIRQFRHRDTPERATLRRKY